MKDKEVWLICEPGSRPPYRSLARYLWGDVDFDSDGNGDENPNWTELTLIHRPDYDERIDINPISEDPLVLKISSSTSGLALRAAEYLVQNCGGHLLADDKDLSLE
jgi:hypothetical protein